MAASSARALAAFVNASTEATTSCFFSLRPIVGGGVALADLEQSPCRAGPGVVLGVGELVLEVVDALGHHEVGPPASSASATSTARHPAGPCPGAARAARWPRRRWGPGVRDRGRRRPGPRGPRPAHASSSVVPSSPSGISDQLSRRPPGRPLGVQGVLQDQHRRRLVDHGPPLGTLPPPVAQHSLRRSPWSGARPAAAPGTGATRRASAPANSRTFTAAGPSPPDSERGRPTTTSTASSSASDRAIRARSPRPRRTVSTGVARNPDGSLRATPIRASPGSMPRRTPCRMAAASRPRRRGPPRRAPAPAPRRCGTRRCRRPGRRRPCRRRGRRPAGRPHGPASLALSPAGAGLVVDRGHDRRPCRPLTPMSTTAPGCPAGSRPRRSSAIVRTSPPSAPSAAGATSLTPSTSSASAASCAAGGEQLGDPGLLDRLLGGAQPLDDVVDPLGQLLGTRLERLGELRDEHVLAGQEPVGVGADQRLDPAYAGADRRLAQQLDHAELAGAPGVGAAAQLARPVADRDDAHLVAVLLAEQRHRAGAAPPPPGS